MSQEADALAVRSRQAIHGSRARRGRLKAFVDIIYALMMHDIKNRFFGSGIGQIVMIIWPFAHILLLITIYTVMKRPNPYGESIIQYSAVSVFPFIIFNYVSRWIVFSAITNKVFLNYTVIRPLDVLIARTLLEIVSITIVGILLLIFVAVMGFTIMPSNELQAFYAVLGTIFLAVGMGFLNAPFAFMFPLWNLIITLMIIGLWVTSGVTFVVSELPENLKVPLSYNPLLHCVEWFRIGYYSDYPTQMLDRSYVLECGLIMLTFGLIFNKLFRKFYM